MSRTFAYARVSTFEQTPENQIREIEAAGFGIEPHRIIAETVSGSMAIVQREGFSRLIDKMEKEDVLVFTKLDRLGRDAIDVSMTVARLDRQMLKLRSRPQCGRHFYKLGSLKLSHIVRHHLTKYVLGDTLQI